jgi:hypothetical protein
MQILKGLIYKSIAYILKNKRKLVCIIGICNSLTGDFYDAK